MPRAIKISITVVSKCGRAADRRHYRSVCRHVAVHSVAELRREIRLANQASLIIDGQKRSRSEHGFSQRAGYRPAGSTKIEWFGDVSDGVEPEIYQAGPLV